MRHSLSTNADKQPESLHRSSSSFHLEKVHSSIIQLTIILASHITMPALAKLSDAAIALSKALDDLNVDHGIFGGFAVAAIGGPRESKDIDCAVGCSKEWLVSALSKVKGFKSMGNSRPDLAQFLYGDGNVLVEFFPSTSFLWHA